MQQSRPSTPPQQKPHTQTPPQQAPQGGGGMGMMGTIASVAAGSMIGNVLADKMMGGGEAQQQIPQANNQMQEQPCAQFRSGFDSCLFQNSQSIYQCQQQWENYRVCMNNNNNWS
jgi:predicted lipid-binding transport protein (Tim44 family)